MVRSTASICFGAILVLFLVMVYHVHKVPTHLSSRSYETTGDYVIPMQIERTKSTSISKYGKVITGTDHLVLFNAVPKCGSRTLISLMGKLKDSDGKSQFKTMINLRRYMLQARATFQQNDMSKLERSYKVQREEQRLLKEAINTVQSPAAIVGHFKYEQYERSKPPIFINIIREPLARTVSEYYFLRYGDSRISSELLKEINKHVVPEYFNETFNECVLNDRAECVSPATASKVIQFFCGNHPDCSKPTHWALEQAKRNVEKYYLFVGLIEEYESTLNILEHLAPDLFKGLIGEYKKPKEVMTNKTKSFKGEPPSAEVHAIMREKFDLQYQFYDFIKKRFEELRSVYDVNL